MRWFYLAVIVVFAIGTVIFAFQNLETVTMSFLGVSARAPLAVVVAVVYFVGAVTGSSVFALLRRSYERSKRGIAASS